MSVHFSPLLSGSYSVDFSLYLCLKSTPPLYHVCVCVFCSTYMEARGQVSKLLSFHLVEEAGCLLFLHAAYIL